MLCFTSYLRRKNVLWSRIYKLLFSLRSETWSRMLWRHHSQNYSKFIRCERFSTLRTVRQYSTDFCLLNCSWMTLVEFARNELKLILWWKPWNALKYCFPLRENESLHHGSGQINFTDQFAVTIYKYQQVWFWPCSQGRILFKANQERCLSEKKHVHATLTQIEDATKQMKERVSVL